MHFILLADGFEEVEALCPLDIMRRADLNVQTVGIGKKTIVGAHGITVTADMTEKQLLRYMYVGELMESLILPGGMPGTLNLDASSTVHKAIEETYGWDESYICAICAAPSILGKMDLLNGVRATCFPGFEKDLHGAILSKEKVVTDGRFITAAGMGAALQFGLAIVEANCGRDTALKIREGIQTP